MESIRRYVTTTDLTNRGVTNPTTFKTIQAERDIDMVMNTFYEGPFIKAFTELKATKKDVVFTTTQATITGETQDTDYYSFTVIEILSGVDKGELIAVENSATSGSDTVLTFFDIQTITPATLNCAIYQEGKFPRYEDMEIFDGERSKRIPQWVKDCVAYQYLFREENAQLFTTPHPISSYKVDRASYQEDYDTSGNVSYNIENNISPDALGILRDKGMLGTTI